VKDQLGGYCIPLYVQFQGGTLKTNVVSLIVSVIAAMAATPGFAVDAKQCKPPEKTGFSMKVDGRSFRNDDRFIVFQQGENIKFISSLRSAGTITWDFGDDGSETKRSSDGTYQESIHRFTVPGIYTVKLSAARNCGVNEISNAGEATASVHIYDEEISGYGVCKEYTAIPNNVLKGYKEHALMSLIVLLRNDRIKREEVKDKIERTVEELTNVTKINEDTARQGEIERLIHGLTEMTSTAQKDEKARLDTMIAELKKIKDIPKNRPAEQKKAANDVDLLQDLFIAFEDRVIETCDHDIARAESRLRRKGNRLARTYLDWEEAKKDKDVYGKFKAGIDQQSAENKTLLNEVKGVTPVTYNDFFRTYDDYDQYYFKFYLGYEYSSTVNSLFKEGTPRAGLAVQYRAWEQAVPDAQPLGFWDGFGFYGIQSSFQAFVTGSAEQATDLSSDSAPASSPTPTIKNTGENKAIEGNLDFFMPLYRTARFNNNKLWGYLGPVVSLGLKKADNVADSAGNTVDRFDRRRYAGVALAFNPELYTAVFYGKTSGLSSDRLEIRAQLPVYKFNNESRLLLGAIVNLGVKDQRPDEVDIMRIYLTWNVDLSNIYEYFTGQKIDKSQ
jgi:hypothetical protein